MSLQLDEVYERDDEFEEKCVYTDDGESDDDTPSRIRYPRYNPNKMCKDFRFQLGMELSSIKEFKGAIQE